MPLGWEEPFGLTILEAMASGTPVVVYAKGAMPELLVDGETGFLVNPSDEDIRGSWQIQKTGMDGLAEAVERIYAMSPAEYQAMQQKCRERVKQHFSIAKMVDAYDSAIQKIVQ